MGNYYIPKELREERWRARPAKWVSSSYALPKKAYVAKMLPKDTVGFALPDDKYGPIGTGRYIATGGLGWGYKKARKWGSARRPFFGGSALGGLQMQMATVIPQTKEACQQAGGIWARDARGSNYCRLTERDKADNQATVREQDIVALCNEYLADRERGMKNPLLSPEQVLWILKDKYGETTASRCEAHKRKIDANSSAMIGSFFFPVNGGSIRFHQKEIPAEYQASVLQTVQNLIAEKGEKVLSDDPANNITLLDQTFALDNKYAEGRKPLIITRREDRGNEKWGLYFKWKGLGPTAKLEITFKKIPKDRWIKRFFKAIAKLFVKIVKGIGKGIQKLINGLCKAARNEVGNMIATGGAVAAGAPPQQAQAISQVAKDLCTPDAPPADQGAFQTSGLGILGPIAIIGGVGLAAWLIL